LVVLIVFAIVLSSVIITLPVSVSAGGVTSTPQDTIIDVVQGQTFLLRHELFFNQSQPGYFVIAIVWDAPSSDDNFTLENAPSVYWISGPENGLPVENVQWDNNVINPAPSGQWEISAWIDSGDKNYVDGNFNVDFWLRAASPDGTIHKVGLENDITYGAGIAVIELSPNIVPEDNVAVNVTPASISVRGVSVSISPTSNSGVTSENVVYTIKVQNTGNDNDNFDLAFGDNAGWSMGGLPANTGIVAPGDNFSGSLWVVIGGSPGDNDNVWVQATSEGDNTKVDNKSAIASNTQVGVTVSISPGSQSGANSATLNYTVTVSNIGGVQDNFALSVGDNAGWSPSVLPTSVVVPAFSSDNTTVLSVTIPSNAIGGTVDNIWVKATSQADNTVNDNKSVTAQLNTSRGVSVSISPSSKIGDNGATLTYTVTVTNTGNVLDNYSLTVSDNASPSWSPSILPTSLVVPALGSDNATLSVTIPTLAIPGTIDNITVTATSQGDNTKSGSASCTAQVAVRGVNVSISPSSQSGADNATLTYTVTISNTGNVSDNYILTDNDNAGWSPSVSPTSRVVAPFSSDNTITLSVTIPVHAIGGTIDNVTVTATSKTDNTVSASANCTGQATIARSVSVSISPTSENGADNTTLTYTVTVSNTGNVSDNYILTDNDNAGWSPSVSPTSRVVAAFSSDNTITLSVTVPSNAIGGTVDNIRVTATSHTDNTVSASASCTAQSTTTARSVRVSISPSTRSGANGATLTYTVTVTNTGGVSDNFSLTSTDNASPSWSRSVSPTLLTLSPGSSENAILSVTVPSNAIGETIDNIRVTATSRTDNTVSASSSCTGQATIARSVSVSISPSTKSGANGTTLTYTITVNNTGNVSDNYSLAATDNSGWSENISPTSLVVAAFSSGSATLKVAVPSNAIKGTVDNIRVTATSHADNTVSNSASCVATSTGQKPTGGISLWVYVIIILVIIVVIVIIVALILW